MITITVDLGDVGKHEVAIEPSHIETGTYREDLELAEYFMRRVKDDEDRCPGLWAELLSEFDLEEQVDE